jgi:hypothetical protein
MISRSFISQLVHNVAFVLAKGGLCTYYATHNCMMLPSIGIPLRVSIKEREYNVLFF